MKKSIILLFTVILSVFTGFAAETDLAMESLLPPNADAFMRSTSLSRLISSIENYKNMDILPDDSTIMKLYSNIKSKSGIDIFDKQSLQKEGLDLSRGFGFAFIDGASANTKSYYLLIPVTDAGKFSIFFANILLKMDMGKKRDLYPAPIPYKNFKIDQIGKDIFTTSIKNYFVICSSGVLARSVIDRGLEVKDNLAGDAIYLNYKQQSVNAEDVSLFIRGSYAAKKISEKYVKRSEQIKSFKALDFVQMSLNLEKTNLAFKLNGSFKKSDSTANNFLNIFNSGLQDMALYDRDSILYSFISIDLKLLDKFLPGSVWNEKYSKMLKQFADHYGVSFRDDFIQNSHGVVNILMNDYAKSEKVFFIPMSDSTKSLALYGKIKTHIEKKYKLDSGLEPVDKTQTAAYFIDEMKEKQYIFCDKRGFYFGNSLPLIKKAFERPYLRSNNKNTDIYKQIADENASVFLKIKNDPIIPLTLKLTDDAEPRTMVGISNLNFSVKKNGNDIYVNTDISLSRPRR